MGDIEVFYNKEQKTHIDNMTMYRLLFLYEFLEYMRKNKQVTNVEELMKGLPLISKAHYRSIIENMALPDDVIDN